MPSSWIRPSRDPSPADRRPAGWPRGHLSPPEPRSLTTLISPPPRRITGSSPRRRGPPAHPQTAATATASTAAVLTQASSSASPLFDSGTTMGPPLGTPTGMNYSISDSWSEEELVRFLAERKAEDSQPENVLVGMDLTLVDPHNAQDKEVKKHNVLAHWTQRSLLRCWPSFFKSWVYRSSRRISKKTHTQQCVLAH